jgi:hypothetical protein
VLYLNGDLVIARWFIEKKSDANRERQQRWRQQKKAEAEMANAIEQLVPSTLSFVVSLFM